MNCKHCYSRALMGTNETMDGTVLRKDWLRLLKDASKLGCFKINLVYGEPLLSASIFKFLRDAYLLDFDVEVGTNGSTITPEISEKLWQTGVRKIHVSIDFPDSRNDHFRRFPGSFRKATEGIKFLRNYPFRIKIATTQLSLDAKFYQSFLDLMKKLRVDTLYFLPERECRQ